jgi:chemotaxis regulatin CheY-phosphate phosphatase CheZ
MTQEELDALINGGVDELADSELSEVDAIQEEPVSPPSSDVPQNDQAAEKSNDELYAEAHRRASAQDGWPPPPPTDDHKVVNQLDIVTRDSEQKATQIFDKLEVIADDVANIEMELIEASNSLDENIELFEKLTEKFPNVESFTNALEANQVTKEKLGQLGENAINASNEIMEIMDIMQYQDIHRQKIERVVNVMRALAGYMNSLFESAVDDSKRTSSAIHIDGDQSTEHVATVDEIEELIAKLGKN